MPFALFCLAMAVNPIIVPGDLSMLSGGVWIARGMPALQTDGEDDEDGVTDTASATPTPGMRSQGTELDETCELYAYLPF
jgi:hypothetical protein